MRQHGQEFVLAAIRVKEVRRQACEVVGEPLPFGHVLADRRECRRASGSVRQYQHLVGHPAGVARPEVPEADLNLAMALFENRRKELVHDLVLIFREEERRHGHATGLVEVVEADHLQSSAVDKKRNTVEVAHADEVGAALDEHDKLLALGFDTFAVGDVAHDFRRADDVACVVFHGRDRQ